MKIGAGLCQSKLKINKRIINNELTNNKILKKLEELSKELNFNKNLYQELEEIEKLQKQELDEKELEELEKLLNQEDLDIINPNLKGGKIMNNYSPFKILIAKILYYLKIYKDCFDQQKNRNHFYKIHSNLNILLDNLLNNLCNINNTISLKIRDIKRLNNILFNLLDNNININNDTNEIINKLLNKSIEYIKVIYKLYKFNL
jgi:hypothetical protein